MPLNVRIKVLSIVLLAFAACGFLFFLQPWLGISFLILALLYVEMIYPKWNFFGRAILNVKDKGSKAVAITFDDGPSPWTLPILDALRSSGVKATFFLLGENVDRHPEIAKKILTDGHAIGFHGYAHKKYYFRGPSFIRNDLDLCEKALHRVGITQAKLIRFPHGFKNIFAVHEAKRRNLKLCSWGKGVWDSKRPGVQKIVERSLKLKAGEILLLHDGNGVQENPDRVQTAEALPYIINGLKAKGYQFVVLE